MMKMGVVEMVEGVMELGMTDKDMDEDGDGNGRREKVRQRLR